MSIGERAEQGHRMLQFSMQVAVTIDNTCTQPLNKQGQYGHRTLLQGTTTGRGHTCHVGLVRSGRPTQIKPQTPAAAGSSPKEFPSAESPRGQRWALPLAPKLQTWQPVRKCADGGGAAGFSLKQLVLNRRADEPSVPAPGIRTHLQHAAQLCPRLLVSLVKVEEQRVLQLSVPAATHGVARNTSACNACIAVSSAALPTISTGTASKRRPRSTQNMRNCPCKQCKQCASHSQVSRQQQAALVSRGQGSVQVVALCRPPLLGAAFLCRARSRDMTAAFGTHGMRECKQRAL